MSALPIIHTTHLFPELDRLLIELLQSLSPEEWQRPTIVPRWNVHQVACHLLDTALRRLSSCRDGWVAFGQPVHSEDLVRLVNRVNEEGVAALHRWSPQLLIEMTVMVTPQLAHYFESLDPMAPAPFAVSWAGERDSLNWFDVARDYTERWHHQQQIRLATDRPGIMTPPLYAPVLETFMRSLPHTYRDVDARPETRCDVIVSGNVSGAWSVTRTQDGWQLDRPSAGAPAAATCVIPCELAWRVFTKGLTRDEAKAHIQISGDARLGEVVVNALAIVG